MISLWLAAFPSVCPQKAGYLYQEGGIYSPDGHCRAFDARAQGTVFGNGVGIVVLKRLQDALADGDCIHAVIKGSAINNDGSSKVGYTAPSVDGQAKVIARALAMADIDPETVSYIEAHGTGTALGDPIEIAALTQAFRASTDKKGFCAIGSVKTNIGHLNAAAGVTGLIKTVLALKHKMIPPSLHFEQPNPQIDFANSPFYVNTTLSDWQAGEHPRRAGVSSFGIGGTNAHVVLEEAPPREASESSRPWQVLMLSAKTPSALETATANLAEHFKQHPEVNLADVAYTLQMGRRAFNHRRMLVCHDLEDALTALETLNPQRVFTDVQESRDRPVIFMFPGQGAQYVNMALELYQVEPTFREQVDLCSDFLKPHLGFDLREVLYPSPEQADEATQQLQQTWMTQPALFVIEYALAKLWMAWGIHPQAMIGHSIGEYVAACLAGVFSLEDALSAGGGTRAIDAAAARWCHARRAPAGAGAPTAPGPEPLSRGNQWPIAVCGVWPYSRCRSLAKPAHGARRELSTCPYLPCLSFGDDGAYPGALHRASTSSQPGCPPRFPTCPTSLVPGLPRRKRLLQAIGPGIYATRCASPQGCTNCCKNRIASCWRWAPGER